MSSSSSIYPTISETPTHDPKLIKQEIEKIIHEDISLNVYVDFLLKEDSIGQAANSLGENFYRQGKYEQSYKWHKIAAELGQCSERLEYCLYSGKGCEINVKEALAWLLKSNNSSERAYSDLIEDTTVKPDTHPDQFIWKIVASKYYADKNYSSFRNRYPFIRFSNTLNNIKSPVKENIINHLLKLSPVYVGHYWMLVFNSYFFKTSAAIKLKHLSEYYFKLAAERGIVDPDTLEYIFNIPRKEVNLKELALADNIIALSFITQMTDFENFLIQLKVFILSLHPDPLAKYNELSSEVKSQAINLVKRRAMTFFKSERYFTGIPKEFGSWLRGIAAGNALAEMVKCSHSDPSFSSDNVILPFLKEGEHKSYYQERITYILGKSPNDCSSLKKHLPSVNAAISLRVKKDISSILEEHIIGFDLNYNLNYVLKTPGIFKTPFYTFVLHFFMARNTRTASSSTLVFTDIIQHMFETEVYKGFMNISSEKKSNPGEAKRLIKANFSKNHNPVSASFLVYLFLVILGSETSPSNHNLTIAVEQANKIIVDPEDNFIFLALLRKLRNHFKTIKQKSICKDYSVCKDYIKILNKFDPNHLYSVENEELLNLMLSQEPKESCSSTTILPTPIVPVSVSSLSSVPVSPTIDETKKSESVVPNTQTSVEKVSLAESKESKEIKITIEADLPFNLPPPYNPNSTSEYQEVQSFLFPSSPRADSKSSYELISPIEIKTSDIPLVMATPIKEVSFTQEVSIIHYVKNLFVYEDEQVALIKLRKMQAFALKNEMREFLYHYLIYCAFTKNMIKAYYHLCEIAFENHQEPLIHFFNETLILSLDSKSAVLADEMKTSNETSHSIRPLSSKDNILSVNTLFSTVRSSEQDLDAKVLAYHYLLLLAFKEKDCTAFFALVMYAKQKNNTTLGMFIQEQIQESLSMKRI